MTLDGIDTPAVLIDLNIAERNIDRFQKHCDAHGINLRPHIKTHKLPFLAQRQVQAGAIGITCQKVSEAEAMVSEGIDDILIAFNVLGEAKVERLRALADKVRLSVVADNEIVVRGLSKFLEDTKNPLSVLVECDTGGGRCGVARPKQAADLAKLISNLPGLAFGGLMTYPKAGHDPQEVQEWLVEAKVLCEDTGLDVGTVSYGGSPGMWRAQDVSVATEYRIGTYIYNDRSLVNRGVCEWEHCALSVLVTVVSVPSDDRAVVDAGSKVLTSDLLGMEDHGHVLGRSDIGVAGLSEEHGVLRAENIGLNVGDRLRIIPNHACAVSNMLDDVHLIRGDTALGPAPVVARGKVW